MNELSEMYTPMIQNLKDAGCDEYVIVRFIQLQETRNTESQLRLLSEQRLALLGKVHESQRKVDCLDYLIYQVKKCRKHG